MAGVNKGVIVELYKQNNSIPEVAAVVCKSLSTVRYHLHKAGVLRSRGDGVRVAAQKGLLCHMKGRKRIFTDEHKKAIRDSRKIWGIKNAVGFSIKPSGYCEVTVGVNKGRRVHDVIMEAIMGRTLEPEEIVHHIDGNTTNNDPRNLKIMNQGDHLRHHRKQDMHLRMRDKIGRFAPCGGLK